MARSGSLLVTGIEFGVDLRTGLYSFSDPRYRILQLNIGVRLWNGICFFKSPGYRS